MDKIRMKANKPTYLLFYFHKLQTDFCSLYTCILNIKRIKMNSSGGETVWKIVWSVFVFKLYHHYTFAGVCVFHTELHKIRTEFSSTTTFRRIAWIKYLSDRGFILFTGGTLKQHKSTTQCM